VQFDDRKGEAPMSRIIVVAECVNDSQRRVVLEERVLAAHLDSDQSSAQLVERLGWAIVDADAYERADIEDRTQRRATDSGW
jgi:hypothetical protein